MTIKCTHRCCNQVIDGISKKLIKELIKKHASKDDEHHSTSHNCRHERKCDREHVPDHKPEPYVAPAVNKHICRDMFCKTHFMRPIIRPSSSKNMPPIPPSPLCPPPNMPFYGPQRPMYPPLPPSPLLTQNNGMTPYGYPTFGGNQWWLIEWLKALEFAMSH